MKPYVVIPVLHYRLAAAREAPAAKSIAERAGHILVAHLSVAATTQRVGGDTSVRDKRREQRGRGRCDSIAHDKRAKHRIKGKARSPPAVVVLVAPEGPALDILPMVQVKAPAQPKLRL